MTFRAFIAVEIGALPGLTDLAEGLRGTRADIKLVEPENIHITLKFLGDTEEDKVDKISEIMTESADGIRPFDISLERIGAFPNLNYMKVVWVGLEGAEVLVSASHKLNSGLSELGFKSDKKGFKPHVTIARVRSPRNKSELRKVIDAHSTDSFGSIHVDRFILKKSVLSPAGPTYSDVRQVNL